MRILSMSWGEHRWQEGHSPYATEGKTVVEICFADNDGRIRYADVIRCGRTWDVYLSETSVYDSQVMSGEFEIREDHELLFFAGESPRMVEESPYRSVLLIALAAAQRYNVHSDDDWKGDNEERDEFIAPYLHKGLEDCEVPAFEDEMTYLFSEERDRKEEEINTMAAGLLERITALEREDGIHGLFGRKEREWLCRTAKLILEYYSLEDHLCNAGRFSDIREELEEVMEEHTIGKYLDEGVLPDRVCDLSIRKFAEMKRKTREYYG